jgi:hypothetical protein
MNDRCLARCAAASYSIHHWNSWIASDIRQIAEGKKSSSAFAP